MKGSHLYFEVLLPGRIPPTRLVFHNNPLATGNLPATTPGVTRNCFFPSNPDISCQSQCMKVIPVEQSRLANGSICRQVVWTELVIFESDFPLVVSPGT